MVAIHLAGANDDATGHTDTTTILALVGSDAQRGAAARNKLRGWEVCWLAVAIEKNVVATLGRLGWGG